MKPEQTLTLSPSFGTRAPGGSNLGPDLLPRSIIRVDETNAYLISKKAEPLNPGQAGDQTPVNALLFLAPGPVPGGCRKGAATGPLVI